MKNKFIHISLYWLVNLCRLLLALTFIFSGFVKAVDPLGMLYKLNAYCTHWGFAFEEDSLILKFSVILMAAVEFILGIYLLLGIRKRFTTGVTLVVMVTMTMLTVYIYAYNPVSDCGCFGEAITLTNTETLVKNIFLLSAAFVVVSFRHYMKRLISERNQWLTSIYSWIYIIVLGMISFHYLPVIDFMPFKVGTDLRAAWNGELGEDTPEDLMNFALFDAENGEEVTQDILNDTSYTFLLTMSKVNIADDGCNDRINDIFDDCSDRNYSFYAAVSDNSNSADINDWTDRTGAAYSFLKCDAVLLKAMVRSNPGLLLLKDGVIVKKWSNNDLPVLSEDKNWNQQNDNKANNSALVKLLLWFIIPLSIVITLDGIWIGKKYFKHYIFKRTLKKSIDHEKENCSR